MHCIRTQANSTQCVVLWSHELDKTEGVVRPFSEKQCKTHLPDIWSSILDTSTSLGRSKLSLLLSKCWTSISQNMIEMGSLCHWFRMHRIYLVGEDRENQWNIILSVKNSHRLDWYSQMFNSTLKFTHQDYQVSIARLQDWWFGTASI